MCFICQRPRLFRYETVILTVHISNAVFFCDLWNTHLLDGG